MEFRGAAWNLRFAKANICWLCNSITITLPSKEIFGFVSDQVSLVAEEAELLKRIIGLHGDLVKISDHQFYDNDELLNASYAY